MLQVLAQIAGKMKQLPEVRACQANITNPATLQRLMHSFEHALQLLVAQASELTFFRTCELHSVLVLIFWRNKNVYVTLTQPLGYIAIFNDILFLCMYLKYRNPK